MTTWVLGGENNLNFTPIYPLILQFWNNEKSELNNPANVVQSRPVQPSEVKTSTKQLNDAFRLDVYSVLSELQMLSGWNKIFSYLINNQDALMIKNKMENVGI